VKLYKKRQWFGRRDLGNISINIQVVKVLIIFRLCSCFTKIEGYRLLLTKHKLQ